VTTVDMSPFTVSSFAWGNRRFQLRHPVLCIPSFVHDVWVYECPPLRLHAFSKDRSEAVRQFHEEFAFLWDGLAGEPDGVLTPNAALLRDSLRAQVANVEIAAL
jgi:hypothetical protein